MNSVAVFRIALFKILLYIKTVEIAEVRNTVRKLDVRLEFCGCNFASLTYYMPCLGILLKVSVAKKVTCIFNKLHSKAGF